MTMFEGELGLVNRVVLSEIGSLRFESCLRVIGRVLRGKINEKLLVNKNITFREPCWSRDLGACAERGR